MSREKPEPVLPQLPPPVAGTIGAMGERVGDTHPTIAAIVARGNSNFQQIESKRKGFVKSSFS